MIGCLRLVMGHAVFKLKEQSGFKLIEGGKTESESTPLPRPSQEMIVLSAILIILQISDGILTGLGMNMFGTAAEGNIFLRALMESWGYIPALVICKSVAIGVIAGLCCLSTVVAWLPKAMRGVIAIYLVAAIIPWTYILISSAL